MLNNVKRWHGGQLVVAVIALLLIGFVTGVVGVGLVSVGWADDFSRRDRCAPMIEGRMESARQWDRTYDSLYSLLMSDSLPEARRGGTTKQWIERVGELETALLRGADCDRIAEWWEKQRSFLAHFLALGMPLLTVSASLVLCFVWFGTRRPTA